MARALASTAFTAKIDWWLGVDDDNATIAVWGNGSGVAAIRSAMTVDAGVSVATESYNGATLPYIRCTKAVGGYLYPQRVSWATNKPAWQTANNGARGALLIALRNAGAVGGTTAAIVASDQVQLRADISTGNAVLTDVTGYGFTLTGSALGASALALAAIRDTGSNLTLWRCAPGAARTIDIPSAAAVLSSSFASNVAEIGGYYGNGAFDDLRIYAVCALTSNPTQAEFETFSANPYAAAFGSSSTRKFRLTANAGATGKSGRVFIMNGGTSSAANAVAQVADVTFASTTVDVTCANQAQDPAARPLWIYTDADGNAANDIHGMQGYATVVQV